MPVPSYLSSFLWMQQLRGADAFVSKFAGGWLVWEPGTWRAPQATARSVTNTISFDGRGGSTAPGGGDFLCFHLGAAATRTFLVGREPDNDLVINDGTVSRKHVVLFPREGHWHVKRQAGRVATLGNLPVDDEGVLLKPGHVLTLGGVNLSVHDSTSLIGRLALASG